MMTRRTLPALPAMVLLLGLGLGPVALEGQQAPTFLEVVGHAFGERITLHHQMVRYLERLEAESPRVRLVNQGRSWEGRELILAVVTSPENHERLDEIQGNAQRLADPRRTSAAEAEAIIADQPAIAWFGGSIHGFELSGTEGALKLLEHLTTREDPATLEVLANSVVLIDPILNPDGRDAFAHFNHVRLGRIPHFSRTDWNNDFTRWESLSFRTGHYFFDTNRDWMAHTQPETRYRMPVRNAWRPQIAVDMHEMGSEVEFFFDPPSGVCCRFFPEYAQEWQERFGLDFAAAFDSAGFHYTTGDMWTYSTMSTTGSSSYHGAVGMLFEQSGTRGLAIARSDGSVRRLADGMTHQYVGAWTAARTVAREREGLLRDYYEAHAAALEEGGGAPRRFLITPEGDPNLFSEAANLLRRHAIEVGVLTGSVELEDVRDREGRRLGSREFPAGTLVVEAAQPRSRLIRELLEPKWDAPMTNSAFPLAHLLNVRSFDTPDGRSLPLERLEEDAPVAAGGPVPGYVADLRRTGDALGLVGDAEVPSRGSRTDLGSSGAGSASALDLREAGYAYLIDGRQAAALSALYHLLDQGYRAAVTLRPTRMGGTDYASGTVVVRVGQNRAEIHAAVRELAGHFHLEVSPQDSGLAEPGHPVLGAPSVIAATRPEIALLAEGPVDPLSFGGTWYTLDRLYEIPHSVLRAHSLASAPLYDFDVLILPELQADGLRELLGRSGVDRLQRWVEEGGVVVAVGSAGEFAREVFELGLRDWFETDEAEGEPRMGVSGGVYPAELDPDSWLGVGYDSSVPVFVNSNRIYAEPEGGSTGGRSVAARYAAEHPGVETGMEVPSGLQRLAGGVVAYDESVGSGRVVVLAEDPNFRGYWRGADRLFLNAVVLGASVP